MVAFPHGEGCGHSIGPDTDQLRRTLGGVLDHPNVSAAIILGLGCEVNQIDHYLGPNAPRTDRLVGMTLQGSGGTRGDRGGGAREIARFIEQAARGEARRKFRPRRSCSGLNCGGSDSFSGITANPALGYCSDLLAEIGATAVLAETTEIFGAEHLLVKRARNREVGRKAARAASRNTSNISSRFGGSFDDNPSPGNKEGGLTQHPREVAGRGGQGRHVAADGRVRLRRAGHAPGLRLHEHAGLRSGVADRSGGRRLQPDRVHHRTRQRHRLPDDPGDQDRHQHAPRTAACATTWTSMPGAIADGDATVQQSAERSSTLVLRVASGERTCAERLGHKEFVPWRIGPVL